MASSGTPRCTCRLAVVAGAIFLLDAFVRPAPAHALPKGLADLDAVPVVYFPPSREGVLPEIRELPPERRGPESPQDLAVEMGLQVGRVIGAWSEGTSIPLLGPVVRGFVDAGRRAYQFQESMKSRYGLFVRPVGREGVAVMMRRSF